MKLQTVDYCLLIRRLATVLGLLLFIFTAAPVLAAGDEETVALNFLQFLGSDKLILSEELIDRSLLDPSLSPVTVAWLFHLQGGGYILVSQDRSISPVKAYSLASDFTLLPETYRRALLAELELRVRVAAAGPSRSPLAAGPTETESQWDFLLNFNGARIPLLYAPDTYLIQTSWNQGYPYNKFLPVLGSQTVPAGCVNVAVGQVMRYYRYPALSKGVASYTWKGPPAQGLKTILYRSYNWGNMPNAIDAATPEYQADEVALLMRDLGIANHTNFDSTGSSTSLKATVLTENFGYSTTLAEMKNTDSTLFFDKLKEQINLEQPVLLTFPGHMVVADGYSSAFGHKIHLNMGWGGTADNFYFLDSTVQAGGYNFTTAAGDLSIYYNLKPCSGSDCAVNLESGDGISNLKITGNFNQNKDSDIYEVYLKGATTFTATRGYGNVAFYVGIVSAADSSTVFSFPDQNSDASTTFSAGTPLPAGKYLIHVSLCNDDGTYCFPPDVGHNSYTVTLTSETVAADQLAVIDQLLEKPPVISNAFPDLVLNATELTRKILIDARDENGDIVTLSVANSNPAAVTAVLNGNILELTPTGAAKISSRISVSAAAKGKTVEKAFKVMTDNGATAFGTTFSVGGSFVDNTKDFHKHRVILDGVCTIHGDNGYTPQGFYSSVLDANGSVLVAPTNPPIDISGNFSRGIYQLGAALYMVSGNTTNWFTTGIGAAYVLQVSCPQADTTTTTIAGLLGIDLSGAALPPISPVGDVNEDGSLTLADAILVLQLLSDMDMTGKKIQLKADVNGDGKIGLAELIFILQKAAGLRSP